MKSTKFFLYSLGLFLGLNLGVSVFDTSLSHADDSLSPSLLEALEDQYGSYDVETGDRIVIRTKTNSDDHCNWFVLVSVVAISKDGTERVLFEFKIPISRPCPSPMSQKKLQGLEQP